MSGKRDWRESRDAERLKCRSNDDDVGRIGIRSR